MSTDWNNIPFEDPELKAALGRALPKMAAPGSLRMKVEQAMGDAVPGAAGVADELTHEGPWHIAHWLPTHHRLAIAAAVAGLGLGIGLYFASQQFNGTGTGTTMVASANPVVERALVSHDALFASLSNGEGRRELVGLPQVREQLRKEQSISIPQADLTPAGWNLVGGRACDMGGCCGAQLFYTRGNETMSIFVFPPGQISPEMANAVDGKRHITALRKIPGATLFIVAHCPSGDLQKSEIEELASHLAGSR